MRNKKLLWIFVLILLVSSVVVEAGVGDWLKGLTSKISGVTGGTSIIYLLVNTLIMVFFFFIVVHLLPERFGGKHLKPKSKYGTGVLFAVLLIVSIIFAIRIGNMYIWHEDAIVKPSIRYLFSGQEPLGILRPTRIWIFAGAAFLLSWLFIETVKIGQGTKEVDIVIATILAAEMAHQGLTKSGLVAFGQIISIWLLYRSFRRDEDKDKFSWSAAWWAAGLVVWISAVAFPGVGILGGLTSLVRKIGYLKYVLYLAIGGVLVTIISKFVGKKEKEAKERMGWGKNALQYIAQPFINLANKIRIPFIEWLLKKVDIHDITPGAPEREEWSFSIKKIWMELFTLMNYLLRLEVYYAKGGVVVDTKEKTKEIYSKAGLKIYSKHTCHVWMDMLKNGTGYVNVNGKFKAIENRKYVMIDNDGSAAEKEQEGFYGGMGNRFIIFKFLELLKGEIEGLKSNVTVGDADRAVNLKMPNIMGLLKDPLKGIEDNQGRYEIFKGRIGAINVVDSYRLNVLNQLCKYGSYKHKYKFAAPGARIYNVECRVDKSKDQPFGEIDIQHNTATDSGTSTPDDRLVYEVDQNGYFLEDWNELRMSGNNGVANIRKVKYEDIMDHPDFRKASEWLATEWDFFVKDVRDGRFHPLSKGVSDYTDIHAEHKYNYRGVVRSHGPPKRGNAAFDREALLDIGRFIYWGRKRFSDRDEDDVNVDPVNPFPGITTIGLSTFISDYIDEFAKESGKQQRKKFVWETSGDKELFTNYPEKKGES